MLRNKGFMILSVILATFISCSQDKVNNGQRVARVGDKVLYLSDVDEYVPDGIGTSDSTLMAEDFIKKWIQKELLIKKAEENLSGEQKNVSRELEDYRNSLIIYKYKKEMVRQKMDSVVTNNEIEDYYNQHSETFMLKDDIVKAVFVKVPLSIADPAQLKLFCGHNSDDSFSELREYCLQYAKSFDTFNNNWVGFSLVLRNVPEPVGDPQRFLVRNNLLEMRDADYYYLVCISDYRLAGNPAPVAHVSGQIKNLILNKRKLDFIKDIETDIYYEGLRNNKFNIYDIEN